jgi:hypothetical protein
MRDCGLTPRSLQMRPALFWDIISQRSLQMGPILTLEGGTDRLSRNVGTELLLYDVKYPRTAQVSG